ncbi:MAG: hypothetical protein QOI50_371 [Pseudonocardiales bacterium]|nr:hypothetical protein [Pseudonocardiales bacterium]
MSAQDAATTEKLPFDVKELTPEWFSAALSIDSPGTEVAAVEVSHIIWGTATKVLVRLDYAARPADGPPERLCVKGCFDTALLELGMGPAYSAEAHFYASVAPAIAIPAPRSWYARTNPDQQQGILVLDDLAATGCSFGDPTEPWHPDRVAAGLEVLAGLHAATAGADRARYPWLAPQAPVRAVADMFFTPEYWDNHFGGPDGPPIPDDLRDMKRVLAAFRRLWELEDSAPRAISHGDPHIGNTYIDADGRPAFLDWQGICANPPLDDVAYWIAGALTVEDRRAQERALLDHYREALTAAGSTPTSPDQMWQDYRRQHLHGFLWSLTGPRMQPRERVFAMSERHVAAIEDHETLALLT